MLANVGIHCRVLSDFFTALIEILPVGLLANLSGTSKIKPLSAKTKLQLASLATLPLTRHKVLLNALVLGVDPVTPKVTVPGVLCLSCKSDFCPPVNVTTLPPTQPPTPVTVVGLSVAVTVSGTVALQSALAQALIDNVLGAQVIP